MAKLVDRGQHPDDQSRKFSGVSKELLPGRPVDGGFGVMPWMQHIKARHSWWGAQFASAPANTEVPWILIGRKALQACCRWWGPLALFDCSSDTQRPDDPASSTVPVPPPLRRMIAALQALGPVKDVRRHVTPLQPGPWCVACSLVWVCSLDYGRHPWGCVLWPAAVATCGWCWFARSTLNTMGDAVHAMQVASANSYAYGFSAQASASELQDLQQLVGALPAAWRQAIASALPPVQPNAAAPAQHIVSRQQLEVEAKLVARVGWQLPVSGKDVMVKSLTVKQATQLQLGPLRAARRQRYEEFATLGLSGGWSDQARVRELLLEQQQQQQQGSSSSSKGSRSKAAAADSSSSSSQCTNNSCRRCCSPGNRMCPML